MIEAVKRTGMALGGGAVAAAAVALVEARTVAAAGSGAHAPGYGALLAADLAVLAPLALGVSFAVALADLALSPTRPGGLFARARAAREEEVLARSRTAALWPLTVLAALAWTVGSAHLARAELARGAPLASGLTVALGSIALLVALAACALAALPWVRRALAAGAVHAPRLVDPVTTGGAALVVAALVLFAGVAAGDTGGDGAFPFGIFGVMKRRELDLRPVVDVLTIALGALLAPIALGSARRGATATARAVVALALGVLPLGLTAVEARALGAHPEVARAIERHAPLGKIALALARKSTDRDRDGFSALFAGGDCDDRDPRRSPGAIDVPGNGIDEDCSGADTPPPPPPAPPPPPPPPSARVADDLNVLLITIDTLRADEPGFAGYPKDPTPNLDKLAAKSTVFDRAYAMASYTGKSIGPMLIGKYPSETERDGGHFNTYAASNTFVAERLKRAGIATMGAASHWYFNGWSGLAQGMQTWDLSAKPSEGQGDNDTSVTSAELANAAIRVLSKFEAGSTGGSPAQNQGRRFFMWVHFFDPHAQYMPHPGSPDFLGDERSAAAAARAAYDAEVWFTDKHIGRLLDYVAEQPWGGKTAIVLTADHGETFNEHGMSFHGYELWEPLVRVPLLVYVPGLEPHHVPVKRGHIDLTPTILDLMGVEPPPPGELRGVSLVPDLLAKDGGAYPERDVYFDMPAGPYNTMRRGLLFGPTPGTKLIHFGAASYQLFDLAEDPGEKDDLSSEKAKLDDALAKMQALRAGLKEIEVKPASAELP